MFMSKFVQQITLRYPMVPDLFCALRHAVLAYAMPIKLLAAFILHVRWHCNKIDAVIK